MKPLPILEVLLMPAESEADGLEASLRKMCGFLSTHSDNACQFVFTGNEAKITSELKVAVYRVFTELSASIVKHAVTSQAIMQCIIYENYIRLSAEDNGLGMIPGKDRTGIGNRKSKGFRRRWLHLQI